MKLLLLAPSTRAMAESARRAGYDFMALDFFGDADQREICECLSLSREFKAEMSIGNLARHSRDLDFTHLVYGSGFENHPGLVQELTRECTVLGNGPGVLRYVRDWGRFFKTLRRAGVPCPETEVVPLEEARERLSMGERLLIKPLKSGGGQSIRDWRSYNEPGEKLGREVLVQEYIEGRPASSAFVADGGRLVFLGASEQLVGTPFNKYRYTGNIAPLPGSEDTLDRVRDVSNRIARAFDLMGCNGIDFILQGETPYVTEVNPRIPGSMEVLEKAYDVNILDLHVRACTTGLKEEVDAGVPREFHGKKVLFAERDILYRVRQRPGFLRDVPSFNELIRERSPICTVLGRGRTPGECIADMEEKERKIREAIEGR